MKQKEFIAELYPLIKKYGTQYNVLCFPAVMAQAIIESSWGKSTLAAKYNNFFGMKAGKSWGGKTAELSTNDYVGGKLVKRKQTFRAYDTVEGGICGYFEFLEYKRYKPLHGSVNLQNFARLLVECGYTNYPPYENAVITTAQKYVLPYVEDLAQMKSAGDGLDAIARDVIKGVYGNGHETRAVMIYNAVQGRVNARAVGAQAIPGDPVDALATEVIAGAYGNGDERKAAIYEAVRERVNRIIKEG